MFKVNNKDTRTSPAGFTLQLPHEANVCFTEQNRKQKKKSHHLLVSLDNS